MSEKSSPKRTAVMNAALELFVERGFHGAPTSLIAERAGVGVGTIYRYFENKDDLIHSVFHELHDRFHQLVAKRFEEGASLQERLTAMLRQLLTIFIEAPSEFRFLEQYHYSPFAADSGQPEIPAEEHSAVLRLLKEGQDAGVFLDGPLPVLQAIALGPIIFLAKEHITGRLEVDEAAIRLATKACWRSLTR